MVVPTIFSIITAVFPPEQQNVHQFTCIKEKVPDNCEVPRSCQSGGPKEQISFISFF
jgi:hypothetical protein